MNIVQSKKSSFEEQLSCLNDVENASLKSVKLPYVVSLFCGAGGLDLGFKAAGFTISVALDLSEAAVKTHKNNFSNTYSKVADLLDIGVDGVLKIVGSQIPLGSDIAIIGGPPCQGFSRANVRSKHDDPRNKLVELYLNIVRKLQDSYRVLFITIENVLGLKDKKHALLYSQLLNEVKNLGFKVKVEELCSLSYGVPQKRNRIFILGCKHEYKFKKEENKILKPIKTVRQAIYGLPEPTFYRRNLNQDQISFHPNHWTMNPKSIKFSNPDLYLNSSGRSFRRLQWDQPSPTIAFGNREIYVHPEGKRRLSIFEAMLLQGFPKDFILSGNLSEQVEQVSNAVPPPMAKSIAYDFIKTLEQGEYNA